MRLRTCKLRRIGFKNNVNMKNKYLTKAVRFGAIINAEYPWHPYS